MPFPLVGRSREFAHLLDRLADAACPGVLVVGPAGIGKSALLHATSEELRAGDRRVLQLATPPPGALPAAVLLGLIEASEPSPLPDQVLAALARHRTPAGPVVVVCDDVDSLDAASEELLRGASRAGACQLLASRRADHDDPATPGSLAATLQPLPLGGLDVSATRTLAGDVAGARVGGVTGAQLRGHTAGNPLHIVETVHDALESGALHPDPDGTLRSRAGFPLTQGLAQTIHTRLSRLGRTHRRAVELLALGQPLRPDHLRRAAVNRNIVVELESAGLVVRSPVGLVLGHPLQTEAVLAQLPPERRRRHLTRLLEAVDADPDHDRTLRVQLAAWQADLGGEMPDHARINAARSALALGQPDLARKLVEPLVSLDAELVRVELESAGSRPAAALQRLRGLQPLSAGERTRVALVASQVQLLAFGDAAAASRTLEAAPAEGLSGQSRGELNAARALLLLLSGQPGEAAKLARGIDPSASPRTAVEIWVSTSIAEMLTGDLVTAARQAREGLAHLSGLSGPGVLPFAEVQLGCTLVYADLYAGRVGDALQRCREHQSAHLPAGGAIAGLWSSMRGHAELLAGNLHLARDVASDAVAITRAHDPLGHGGLTLADRALAVAMLGDLGTARQLLAELEHRPDASSPRIAVNLARVRAWTAALEEDTSAAVTHALSGASEAAAVGYHSWALLTAHEAVRWGAAKAALPILEASAQDLCDARFLELLVDHARAAAEDDEVALATVADGFSAAGACLHAAEALQQARVLAARRGDARSATALEHRIRDVEVRGAWSLRELPPSIPLTRRERQVGRLAASGEPSRAIAAALAVSTRTVDNHLSAVYRKLGINGRDELTLQLIEGESAPGGSGPPASGSRGWCGG